MRIYLIAVLILVLLSRTHGQLNVELLHQLVQHSKDENERQSTARDKQILTTANEEVNRKQMGTLKDKYRLLQQRFRILSLAMDATFMGIKASEIITSIIDQQGKIISLARDNPIFIPLASRTETDIASKIGQLSKYLYALAVSIGDINQMKQSDRKMLLEHILTELRIIEGVSRGLAVNMQYAVRRKKSGLSNPFSEYINRDKQLIGNILDKLKRIKQ